MPEWLIEAGVGETRAALVDNGKIVAARIELDGALPAGTVVPAQLVSVGRTARNAVARDDQGTEYLLPHAPPGVTEGSRLNIEVTREAIPGFEPWKRPLARATLGEPAPSRPLARRLGGTVRELVFPDAGRDRLREVGWEELVEQARSGVVEFPGGTLRMSLTPAMTLIDVDGTLEAEDLAVAAAAEAARAIRRLGIGGSIGIDLPTVAGKTARTAQAAVIDRMLPKPFERTAVNGFGFIQIVRPRTRPSLLEIWSDRASAEARALLRRTARDASGTLRLVAHPAVTSVLESRGSWLDALARQVGGAVSLRADPNLPMSAGHAEPF